MDLMGLIADQLGFFTPQDLPGLALAVLLAAAMAFGAARLAGASGAEARRLVLWAAVAALGVALVKGSVPFSIALVALALLVRADAEADPRARVLKALAVVVGGGCGTGAAIPVLVGLVPVALIARWALRDARAAR
ncbi:MAG: hypothetical protein IT228_03770 [Flavobacteriales bacterium]|nr:hypothetical protein [Flavobacteriales bacterium]MCC6576439.1 hypothetical protein [Flavobacteriales bacterium]